MGMMFNTKTENSREKQMVFIVVTCEGSALMTNSSMLACSDTHYIQCTNIMVAGHVDRAS